MRTLVLYATVLVFVMLCLPALGHPDLLCECSCCQKPGCDQPFVVYLPVKDKAHCIVSACHHSSPELCENNSALTKSEVYQWKDGGYLVAIVFFILCILFGCLLFVCTAICLGVCVVMGVSFIINVVLAVFQIRAKDKVEYVNEEQGRETGRKPEPEALSDDSA